MLRNRSIAGLVSAELVSLTGSAMTFVALPWFVLAITGSTAKMGWVLAAELLPVAIVGIPAGSLIAKLGAKRTMLLSDAGRGALVFAIPILHRTGDLSFPALLGVTFAVGVFTAPYFASSRVVIPEVVGEDEGAVARVNAVLAGAQQVTQIVGPVIAGLLIAATTPVTVLVVDGCSYLLSFLIVASIVQAGRRAETAEESGGLFGGLRFVIRDRLLGPIALAACVVNFVVLGIELGVQGLAFFRYDASAHVLGYLFGAFGVGALAGALVAQQLAQKVNLLRLAAVALVLMPLPLFLLALPMPWPAAIFVVDAFAFFTPLVNAPIIGVLTVRTPEVLRAKVMTSVLTVATLAGPLGFLAAGEALRYVSLSVFFLVLSALLTCSSWAFGAVLLRHTAAAPSQARRTDVSASAGVKQTAAPAPHDVRV
jgi:MFS family permease